MNFIRKFKKLFTTIRCEHKYEYTYLRINGVYIITKTCNKCGKVLKSKGDEL